MSCKLNHFVFIVLIIVSSCNKKKSIFEKGVYHSIQKGNYLHSSIFYDFREDSLFIYNSATDQKLKFKISYNKNQLMLNNRQIKDYNIDISFMDDSIKLFDVSNYISLDDTIKLDRIRVGNINFKSLKSKFWLGESKRGDSIGLYFSDNKIDYYYKAKNKNEYSYLNTDYKIVFLDKNILVFDIPYLRDDFLLTSNDDENMVFYISSPEGVSNIKFKRYDNIKNLSLIENHWLKVDSKNEFDLPHELNFRKNKITIGEKNMNYKFGLYNKHIILENGSYFNIDKLKKDTLLVSFENSINEIETALYVNNIKK